MLSIIVKTLPQAFRSLNSTSDCIGLLLGQSSFDLGIHLS